MYRGRRSQQDDAAALFFRCGSGGLENHPPRSSVLSRPGSRCSNKFRQHIELLKQGVGEFASALIGRKLLMPIGSPSATSK
jgi:hypothetical protein